MRIASQPRAFSVALLLAAFVSAGIAAPASAPWGGDLIAPIVAPFPMPQLTRPIFPARVSDIRDHGAVAGGATKNTAAIAAAIKACAEAGGGRVLVPAGQWLTGPVHLRSKIELHLAEGAELIFSDRFEDYLPNVLVRVGGVELYNYSPFIYARDCTDVAITGPGRLNGNSQAWWPWAKKETKAFFEMAARGVPAEQRVFGTPEAAIRPNFVVFLNCRNVLMEGFTIGGGPNWTLHPVYCENVIIRRVHVLTEGPNNDGIDPDSCRNVLVEHCVFDTGDDCLVLKSGYNEDGWRVARPTENVVMRWCSSKRGHGGLVIGSEMSGDVRNVYMHDCEFDGTDRAVRIKSRRDRGGVVENVTAERLKVRNMQQDVVIMNMDYTADRNAPIAKKPPLFRNIHIKDVTADGAPIAIRITGLDDSLIENISFENMTIASTQGVKLSHVKNVTFKNVKVTPKTGPVFELVNAHGVIADGVPVETARPR
jgi:polygalacturonase